MMEILISVVIPTCHRNDLLARCLDRLAPGSQTLDPSMYEVIVTDDGSKSTAETMVAERYPWARWVEGPKRGPAANRNWGAEHARGKWLAFTDDDCVPTAGWLEAFAREANDEGQVLEGKTTCEAGVHSPLYAAPVNETGGYLWSCNMAMMRSAFYELGGFDEGFPFAGGEDVEFRERLRSKGHPIRFCPAAIVDHPPRLAALGLRSARLQESQIPLLILRGSNNPYRDLLRIIPEQRLRTLYKSRFGTAWIRAAAYHVVEIAALPFLIPKWRKKYGSRYEPSPRRYGRDGVRPYGC